MLTIAGRCWLDICGSCWMVSRACHMLSLSRSSELTTLQPFVDAPLLPIVVHPNVYRCTPVAPMENAGVHPEKDPGLW